MVSVQVNVVPMAVTNARHITTGETVRAQGTRKEDSWDVVHSGNSVSLEQEMLKAGAMGYVTKTAALTDLPRAIRAVAEGQNFLSSEITAAVVSEIAPQGTSATPPLSALSPREREVLRLVADGVRTAEIARRLGITEATIEVHRRNVMHKLELRTVAQLTKYAVREGLTTL